jgi:hypothetical protein
MEDLLDANGNQDGDQIIHCVGCHQEFLFTAGEEAFYRSRQLAVPKRCGPCRKLRTAQMRLTTGALAPHRGNLEYRRGL